MIFLTPKYIDNIENAIVEFKINISEDYTRKSKFKSHKK